jgi:hypothetical protein
MSKGIQSVVFYVSDCCWVPSNPDICMCSQCGEHCEIIEDGLDYIPGLDDGEAGWASFIVGDWQHRKIFGRIH